VGTGRGAAEVETWADAERLFLWFCEGKGLAQGTIKQYRYAFRRLEGFIEENGGPLTLKEVDRTSLRQFAAYLVNRSPAFPRQGWRRNSGERLSSKTVHNTMVSLRTFFKFLADEGIMADNLSSVLVPPPVRQRVIQALTPAQVQALLARPKRRTFTGQRAHALITLLLDTGLRVSEALSLRVEDVNWREGLLTVMGKGGKERQVPFGATVRRLLWRYVAGRGEVLGHELVFAKRSGERLKPRHLQSALKRYGEKARITGVRLSPHTLRHTFAKMWLLNGGDPFSLQRILGHSSMDMVRRYVDMTSGDVAAQHRRFSPMDRLT
jgi:integrase/recombinase XerD